MLMFHIFAGPITFDNLSLRDNIIIVLVFLGYLAFWAILIFITYKAIRKFIKGDARTRKQTLLALFIVFMTFGFAPVTAGLWEWTSQKYYQRKYEGCIEKYPSPDWYRPNGYKTEIEMQEYENTDNYKICQPIRKKAY